MYVCLCIYAGFIEIDFYFYKFTREELAHSFFFLIFIWFVRLTLSIVSFIEFFVAKGSYMVGFSIGGETDNNMEPFPDEINIVTNVEIYYKK